MPMQQNFWKLVFWEGEMQELNTAECSFSKTKLSERNGIFLQR